MNSINVNTLNEWRIDSTPHQLIDIREPWEREIGHIEGSIHIMMSSLLESIETVKRDCKVVIHCRSGVRSLAAAHHLTTQLGFENVYNLEGGITAWAKSIDPQIEVA
jgi:rhodanese-related sulfurtransferase